MDCKSRITNNFQRAHFNLIRAHLCPRFRCHTQAIPAPTEWDTMLRKQKAVSRGLRHDADVNQRIEAATKEGGFSSASAFMRAAIERELAGRETASMRDATDWYEIRK